MTDLDIQGVDRSLRAVGTRVAEGHVDLDTALVHLAGRRDLLRQLPPPQQRTAAQTAEAARLIPAVREGLDSVARRHAATLYATATEGGRLRITELVDAAAERFPGLLPTAADRSAEASRPPAGRDLLDIDVALFLRAVLREPGSGDHLLDTMRMPTTPGADAAATLDREGSLVLGTVRVRREGVVGHVTLQNTRTLNAEDNELMADLEVAVDAVMLAASVHTGVLRGAVMDHPRYSGRRVFSAGINLKHLSAGRISYLGFLVQRELGFISKMIRGLLVDPAHRDRGTIHTPWLAVVDTFAIGGGMQLALAADHVLADEEAWFSLPAAQEGIVPGMANLRLSRLAGSRIARNMVLGGRRVAAIDADARAFCDEVVATADLDGRTQEVAELLAAPAVMPNKLMLALAQEPQDEFRRYAAEFCVVQAERMYSPDVLGKVGAFARRGAAE